MNKVQICLAVSTLCLGATANAVVVEYIYDAKVTSNQGTSSVISIDDAVTGSIKFDTTKSNFREIYEDTAYYHYNYEVPFGDIDQAAFEIRVTVQASDGNTYSGSSNVGVVQVENNVTFGPNGLADILRPASINDFSAPANQSLGYSTIDDGTYTARVNGDQILGNPWRSITMFLVDNNAQVLNDVSLPTSIDFLNELETGTFTVSLDIGTSSFAGFTSTILDVQAILSSGVSDVLVDDQLTDVIVNEEDLINGAGGIKVQLPTDVEGSLSATYKQQAAEELDFSVFDFAIAGDIFQLWDVDFDNTLIPEGEFVKVVLSYDESLLANRLEESQLQVLRILDDGTSGGLLQVVERNFADNTITVLTPGFSSLGLVEGQVPLPAPLVLIALGMTMLGLRHRRTGA